MRWMISEQIKAGRELLRRNMALPTLVNWLIYEADSAIRIPTLCTISIGSYAARFAHRAAN